MAGRRGLNDARKGPAAGGRLWTGLVPRRQHEPLEVSAVGEKEQAGSVAHTGMDSCEAGRPARRPSHSPAFPATIPSKSAPPSPLATLAVTSISASKDMLCVPSARNAPRSHPPVLKALLQVPSSMKPPNPPP